MTNHLWKYVQSIKYAVYAVERSNIYFPLDGSQYLFYHTDNSVL